MRACSSLFARYLLDALHLLAAPSVRIPDADWTARLIFGWVPPYFLDEILVLLFFINSLSNCLGFFLLLFRQDSTLLLERSRDFETDRLLLSECEWFLLDL